MPAGAIWLGGWLFEKLRHKEGLGFGDVKMLAMIGAFLGIRGALLTVILGSLAGRSSASLTSKSRARMRHRIRFRLDRSWARRLLLQPFRPRRAYGIIVNSTGLEKAFQAIIRRLLSAPASSGFPVAGSQIHRGGPEY